MTPMISAAPTLGTDGRLRWHVRAGEAVVTIDVDTGVAYWNAAAVEAGEAFKAVVGALTEWYKTDTEQFSGLNAMKVREELEDAI